jgi:hypothetical protein
MGYGGLHIQDKAIVLISLSGSEATIFQNGLIGIWLDGRDATVIRGLTIRHCDVAISCGGTGAPLLEDLIIEANGMFYDDFVETAAAVECWSGSPRFVNAVFRNNDLRQGNQPTQGGAVACHGAAAPQFLGCRFEDNIGLMGSAVYCEGASPSFIATQFIGNLAAPLTVYSERWTYDAYGGAIYCDGGEPSFIFCSFIGNEARILNNAGDVYGGAVCLTGNAAPSFLGCSFSGNSTHAPGHTALGGGFYLGAGAAPVLTNCIVAFGGGGGGFYSPADSLALAMTCSDVFGNAGGDFVGLPDPTGSGGNIALDPHFCDREAGDLQLAANSPCLPAHNDCGVQMGVYGQGCPATATPDAALPAALVLAQNSPNPFNPSTAIRFGLPQATAVDLSVHDAAGRRVATLIAGETLAAGYHDLDWRGRDDRGRPLASGVYFLRLEAGAQRLSRKMILLK